MLCQASSGEDGSVCIWDYINFSEVPIKKLDVITPVDLKYAGFLSVPFRLTAHTNTQADRSFDNTNLDKANQVK
jgi:hypothetical protein